MIGAMNTHDNPSLPCHKLPIYGGFQFLLSLYEGGRGQTYRAVCFVVPPKTGYKSIAYALANSKIKKEKTREC